MKVIIWIEYCTIFQSFENSNLLREKAFSSEQTIWDTCVRVANSKPFNNSKKKKLRLPKTCVVILQRFFLLLDLNYSS